MSRPKFIPGRIAELDLLRGFFIFAIILDHAQHLPDIHMYVTGQGKLWVSAAEGFFLISGLLTGYIRGFRQQGNTMWHQTKKLVGRGILLYVWAILITLICVALVGLLPVTLGHVAKLPMADQVTSVGTYLASVFSGGFIYDWIYFLILYAVIMVVAPLFILAARRHKLIIFMAISALTYAASFLMETPYGPLQWQFIFFSAASAGYYLPAIVNWLIDHPRAKAWLIYGSMAFTVATFIVSYFFVLAWPAGLIMSRDQYVVIHDLLERVFSNNPLMPARVALSFVWFIGMIAIFHTLRRPISKYLGWLFGQFGNYSLSVYCLQAVVLVIFNWLVPFIPNFFYNFVVNLGLLIVIWLIMRTRLAKKVLPR
ncbi:MAG TPA: OpgC domain-containing protein [Candidatus Saccharimonadales bacterium]|nr:OpgC domain-containing protein [Candidatus Saccharimonadales bacterium]